MAKQLKFHEEALNAILKGVKTLSKAVIVTLGPRGRNVVIDKEYGTPLSTKDGVTVAKEIELKNKFENLGAQSVKEAASKTNDVAGDGTTTAIVLSEAILSEGIKNVIAGANPMVIKKEIEMIVSALNKELSHSAKEINTPEEIKQIATISANNDPAIGEIIGEAMNRVGRDGIVTIDEAKSIETNMDVVEGMQFDKGYLSPYFVTNADKMSAELENVNLLLVDKKISSAKELVPFLEQYIKTGSHPLLIIAEDIDSEALTTLVINKIKGGLPICAVKSPAFGDRRKAILEDIAALTGATVISEEVGLTLEEVGLEVLGKAKKVVVKKEETTITDGLGDAQKIQERKELIKAELFRTDSDYEKEKLEERLAKLVGGVAVIHVGAATEAEMKEKKMRVEDALHATRAAIAEGVVPGGGIALLRAFRKLEKANYEEKAPIGFHIMRKACFAPLSAIANNCGKQGNLIAEKVYEKEGSEGYNGLTDTFSDLIKDGVLDPVLVTKSALTHASSISSMLITISAVVVEKPEPKTAEPVANPMAGMGGMPGMGGGMPGMGMM